MAVAPKYGWETLGHHLGGRRLVDEAEHHQVSAKIRSDGRYKGWMFVKVWNSQAGWTILALDPTHTVQAQGWAQKEKDAYQMCRDVLGAKGIGAARADLS